MHSLPRNPLSTRPTDGKSKTRLLLVLSCLGALAIASPSGAATDPTVTVSGDKFSKDITFLGPAAAVNPFGGTFRLWRIRSWLNRDTKAASYQLYVQIGYDGGWRFYEVAADDSASDLKVVKIASDVSSCRYGCTLTETVGVDLPEATLKAKAATGFQIKLWAKSGDSLVLDVTPAQIAAQLAAMDRYRQSGADLASSGAPIALPPQPFGVDFSTRRPMMGLPGGVLVSWIKGESVAARAGVRWTDTIIEWDGQPVTTAEEFQAKLATVQPGQSIAFKVLRARATKELTAKF